MGGVQSPSHALNICFFARLLYYKSLKRVGKTVTHSQIYQDTTIRKDGENRTPNLNRLLSRWRNPLPRRLHPSAKRRHRPRHPRHDAHGQTPIPAPQLPLHHHRRLRHGPPIDLGVHAAGLPVRPHKRRHRGRHLGDRRRHRGRTLHDRFDGGDGIHGAHGGRTVSLGFRIRAEERAERVELSGGVDECVGVGYGGAEQCAVNEYACAGFGAVEESGCERGCAVADYAVHHGVYDCLYGVQHFLRQSVACDRGYLWRVSRRGLFRLLGRSMGYE